MKLYLIEQTSNSGYDTYDSAVVAANSAEEAQLTHPGYDNCKWDETRNVWIYASGSEERYTWAPPSRVHVRIIGTAEDETKTGVILASFNAG